MPERLQTAVRVDREVTVTIEGPGEDFLPAEPTVGETEVLHQDELGGGEAVVHLGESELRPRVGHTGLGVGVLR